MNEWDVILAWDMWEIEVEFALTLPYSTLGAFIILSWVNIGGSSDSTTGKTLTFVNDLKLSLVYCGKVTSIYYCTYMEQMIAF